MNKTVSITLGGVILNLEENAYEVLKNYLNSIHKHFEASGDADEIVEDMEASIAEKFANKLTPKKQVITLKDVEDLISVMGEVSDFEEELGEDVMEEVSSSSKKVRKLYRNPDDEVLAGVCSGLAAYFGLDPVLVRLLFILSLFLGGSGIIVYLAFWIAMPVAKTSSQKLEMHGDPVTLVNIQESVKKKLNVRESKNENDFKKILKLPFDFLKGFFQGVGNFFKALTPFVRVLFGSLLSFAAFLAIGFLSFLVAVSVFNVDKFEKYVGFSVFDLLSGTEYYFFVFSAYFSVVVFPLFFLLLGIGFLRKKKLLNFSVASSMIVFWMLSVITFGVFMVDLVPRLEEKSYAIAEAENIEKVYDLKDFNQVSVLNNDEVNIVFGEEFKVTAFGNEKNIDSLNFEVTPQQELLIKHSALKNQVCFFHCDRSVQIDIEMPALEAIRGARSADINVIGFNSDKLDIQLSSSSYLDLNSNSENLFVKMSSSSRASLKGNFKNAETDLSSSSRLELLGSGEFLKAYVSSSARLMSFKHEVLNAFVKASSSGRAEVNVKNELNATASSSGDILYEIEPENLIKDLSSSGFVGKR